VCYDVVNGDAAAHTHSSVASLYLLSSIGSCPGGWSLDLNYSMIGYMESPVAPETKTDAVSNRDVTEYYLVQYTYRIGLQV